MGPSWDPFGNFDTCRCEAFLTVFQSSSPLPRALLAARFRAYLQLAKPGIVAGNLVSVSGGLLLASRGEVSWPQFALILAGVALLIASGCALNNVIDRDVDAVMARTRFRPMVQNVIGVPAAMAFAVLIGVSGMGLLYGVTRHWLAPLLMLVGYAAYVGLYSLWLKRRSVHGTLAGSISGAIPPVVGYCAVSNSMDGAALTLLLMLSLWQMPHSYAIAIFREADYRAATIPVLPVVRGMRAAKRQILLYTIAFAASSILLALTARLGWIYVLAALGCAIHWTWLAFLGFSASDDRAWARRVFWTSITQLTILSSAMATSFQSSA
ncbi:heme o synthase [Stenotrophomonas lactitubi]|uniref:heme o synthase n=1 Tax=Stenotrophomonas lactitubi TaxID=2045214 RepID=UPI003341B7F8